MRLYARISLVDLGVPSGSATLSISDLQPPSYCCKPSHARVRNLRVLFGCQMLRYQHTTYFVYTKKDGTNVLSFLSKRVRKYYVLCKWDNASRSCIVIIRNVF